MVHSINAAMSTFPSLQHQKSCWNMLTVPQTCSHGSKLLFNSPVEPPRSILDFTFIYHSQSCLYITLRSPIIFCAHCIPYIVVISVKKISTCIFILFEYNYNKEHSLSFEMAWLSSTLFWWLYAIMYMLRCLKMLFLSIDPRCWQWQHLDCVYSNIQ